MTVKESDIYEKLRAHLDKMPIGYPKTKSGAGKGILKSLFTPEEAHIAMKLRFGWHRDLESIETIYERFEEEEYSLENLESKLETMAKKGSIHLIKKGDKNYYSNALFMIGMYEFQVNRLSKEFTKDTFNFIKGEYGLEVFGTKISQFRTIPIEESISPEHHIKSYDDLKTIIANVKLPIVATNCICRQATSIVGYPCKVTDRLEVCMGFGPFAQMYIDRGWGREINRDEALEILRKNEEEGLVLQASNALNAEFICSCCGCCCPVLRGMKSFPRPIQFFSTNFLAKVDEELCSGCGICIDRCQMDAIKLSKEISKVNWKKCIGCGNCVPTCPEEAIQLTNKDEEIQVPQTMDDLYDNILKKKLELRNKK